MPEQALNDCARLGIPFWDLRREGPDALSFQISRRDWQSLRARRIQDRPLPGAAGMAVQTKRGAAERGTGGAAGANDRAKPGAESGTGGGYTLRAVGWEGAPYLLRRLGHRPALAIALPILATALFLGSFFVWDYDISGNGTVPEERILRALEQEGVGLGSFGLSLDGEDLRNRVLLRVPELVWIAVNVSGCRANVQVRERVEAPEMVEERSPSNVVARRDGLVLDVGALGGAAAVRPGASVTEGQLLISGAEDMETVGRTRIMAGRGSVTARTWHSLRMSVPLTGKEKRLTGQRETRYALVLGRRRMDLPALPFRRNPETAEGCDKTVSRTRLSLLGIPLPVTVIREEFRFYETAEVSLSPAEGQRRGELVLRRQLEAAVRPYGEIRSVLCASRQRGNLLTVTLQAECVEEIGVSVPILTEEEG